MPFQFKLSDLTDWLYIYFSDFSTEKYGFDMTQMLKIKSNMQIEKKNYLLSIIKIIVFIWGIINLKL